VIAYSFGGVTLPNVSICAAPMPSKAPGNAAPGYSGSYGGFQRPNERKVTLSGNLIVRTSFSDLLDAWSSLSAAHDTGVPVQLCIRDNWYLWAVCESITDSERGVDHIGYQAQYAARDPYYYSATASTPALTTGGGTFTVGGNKAALPTLTLTVSAAPAGGTITVANSATGESFVLSPNSALAYVLDSRLETVTMSGVDATGQFAGQFLTLAVGSNTLTITTAGGATLSAASITFNGRSL
jgi:phage-related protein